MLIHQEFAGKEIFISERTIQLFNQVKSALNERKSENSSPIVRSYSVFQEGQEANVRESLENTEIIIHNKKLLKSSNLEFQLNAQPLQVIDLSGLEKEESSGEEDQQLMEISYIK